MSENNLINIVKTVYNEYRDNPVIFQKLLETIEQLPEVLKNTNDTIINKHNRKIMCLILPRFKYE